MEYIRLGNTGLIVSKLSLGAMTFGSDPSMTSVYKVDEDNANAMVRKALDAGINFFDTANGYSGGQSEIMLGRALAEKREDVVIATKVGFRGSPAISASGLSRGQILSSCEGSLRRLGTDYIDLYIAHRDDIYTPLEETLEAFDLLVKTGKVRYIGFSNWPAWKVAKAVELQKARGWAQFCSGQMHYSLVGRDVEYDVVPFMLDSGIGMTVWSPLAGGFLSGKYTRENLSDPENRLAGFDLIPFDKEAGFAVVEKLRAIAGAHQASVAQVALAWLLHQPVVNSVIVGASKLAQLEDNLKAVEVKPSAEELAELDEITRPRPLYPHWFNGMMVDAVHKTALG